MVAEIVKSGKLTILPPLPTGEGNSVPTSPAAEGSPGSPVSPSASAENSTTTSPGAGAAAEPGGGGGGGGGKVTMTLSQLSAMTAKEIKIQMDTLGVSHEDCLEKSDLVKALVNRLVS